MYTDWILIRRAAAELERALRGLRVADAGVLQDGRPALGFRGGDLVFDVFAGTPVVTLETRRAPVRPEAGYTRAIGDALRGMRALRVGAPRGERILVFDFGVRSRFGVADGYRLVVELIPRFGNVVLVKDGTVIAAAKQFAPAENAQRSIQVGFLYAPPPPSPPGLPRLLRASVEAEGGGPEEAAALLAGAEAAAAEVGELFVYRRAGALVQAHVVPLAQHAGLALTREPSLLGLFAESTERRFAEAERSGIERERAALRRRLERRLAGFRAERARLGSRRDAVATREELRAAGDALYAYGHLVPPRAATFVAPADPPLAIALDPELDAKGNAARFFREYRRLGAALPHVERRLAALDELEAAVEELLWELERADRDGLAEIEALAVAGESRRMPPARPARRELLRYDLDSGARLYVGRSPQQNAEVTFRIGRPNDLWFHAREIPGAHVVLQAPPGTPAGDADVTAAAAAAAFHSRGREAARVAVDYAPRKHVRKQRDGLPGRVWYTHARTLVVAPREPAVPATSA